ncbi:MAG: pentapeptide repeat-containing protein [Actinomycetota bacterium]|nr:pentapeptide repeat-containing protein [Actinomycetota bacterium]
MTTFREQDLTGARFERVSLRGASFTQVFLNDANMHAVDFTGTQIRGALFNESRMRGVEVVDVEISGELQNVVVNGIDIAPLVDAELNRRMPELAVAPVGPAVGRGAGWDGIPWDREARPSLDAVLTVRRERQAMVRHVMESLTDEQLASEVTRTETGWPRAENFPFKECLRIVLNEEWEHRLYAERDLTALENEN